MSNFVEYDDYYSCGNCRKEFSSYYLAETADSAGHLLCVCPFCGSTEICKIESNSTSIDL